MYPLAKRFEARAQRKADNMAESTEVTGGTGIGTAMNAVAAATAAIKSLTPEARERFENAMRDSGGFDTDDDGFRSIAEDENGRLALAGIGTVDQTIVPTDAYNAAAGAPAQATGELPKPSFDPAANNANGAAIDEATKIAKSVGGGWGTGNAAATEDEEDGYNKLSETELRDRLDTAKATYPAKAKKETLVHLLRADDKAKKDAADKA